MIWNIMMFPCLAADVEAAVRYGMTSLYYTVCHLSQHLYVRISLPCMLYTIGHNMIAECNILNFLYRIQKHWFQSSISDTCKLEIGNH